MNKDGLYYRIKRFFRMTIFYDCYTKATKGLSDDKVFGKNIYGVKTAGEYRRKHNFLHGMLKYFIVYPVTKLVNRFAKKHLDRELEDTEENKNLNIFSKAWDDALVEWTDLFYTQRYSVMKNPAKFIDDYFNRHAGPKILRIMKDVGVTMCKADTAWFEFLNMFCFKLAINMNEAYKDYDGTVPHLLYTSQSISDVAYFTANTKANKIMLVEKLRLTEHRFSKGGKLIVKNKRVGGKDGKETQ